VFDGADDTAIEDGLARAGLHRRQERSILILMVTRNHSGLTRQKIGSIVGDMMARRYSMKAIPGWLERYAYACGLKS